MSDEMTCERLDESGKACGADAIGTATITAETRAGRRLSVNVEVCGDHMVSRLADFAKGREAIEEAKAELSSVPNTLQLCAGCEHPRWLHAAPDEHDGASCDFGEGDCECPEFELGEGLACDWSNEALDVACTAPAAHGSRCDTHQDVAALTGADQAVS